MGGQWFGLTSRQLLLQGAQLRNTDWTYGVAVYTGDQSKMGNNKRVPTQKWTRLDGWLNRATVGIFVGQLVLVGLFGLMGYLWTTDNARVYPYLLLDLSAAAQWLGPLRFLLLFSLMIPISLKVTVDACKWLLSQLVDSDVCLYDNESDTPALAACTGLADQLGQVEYVLSDKTGTLTKNIMTLMHLALARGQVVDVGPDAVVDAAPSVALVALTRALALCNAVVPTLLPDGQMRWMTASPDEAALVSGVAQMGAILQRRQGNMVELNLFRRKEQVRRWFARSIRGLRLRVARRSGKCWKQSGSRRSAVACPSWCGTCKRRRWWCFPRAPTTGCCHSCPRVTARFGNSRVVTRLFDTGLAVGMLDRNATVEAVEKFARLGLRTLVVCTRVLNADEYVDCIQNRLGSAKIAMHGREQLMGAAYEAIERYARKGRVVAQSHSRVCCRKLTLLGTTAIRDELQDDVDDTLAALASASIKCWMITGDKGSTARTIAQTCGMLRDGDVVVSVDGETGAEVKMALLENVASARAAPGRRTCVVVTGTAVAQGIRNCRPLLQHVLCSASVVVCSRTSPQQKADLVRLVRDAGHVVLAIGDGGNDVSMIQEADVGVGLSAGKEGMQAALAADFSFAKFCHLRRLLLVHGRYNFARLAYIAQFCVYKSLLLAMMQLFYAFVSAYSGQSLFTSAQLVLFNVAFTSGPIVFRGLDQDVGPAVAMAHPELYGSTRDDRTLMGTSSVLGWIARATLQSLAIFVVCAMAVDGFAHASSELITLATMCYTAVVLVCTLTLVLEANSVSAVLAAVLVGVLAMYWLAFGALSAWMPFSRDYGVFVMLQTQPLFWVTTLLCVVLCLAPLFLARAVRRVFAPRLVDLLQSALLEDGYKKLDNDGSVSGSAIGSAGSAVPEGVELLQRSGSRRALDDSYYSVM